MGLAVVLSLGLGACGGGGGGSNAPTTVRFSGTVTQEVDGGTPQAASGARVSIATAQGRHEATTDAQGRYEAAVDLHLLRLDPAQSPVVVTITKDGYLPVVMYYESRLTAGTVQLPRVGSSPVDTIQLARVIDGHYAPLAGAVLTQVGDRERASDGANQELQLVLPADQLSTTVKLGNPPTDPAIVSGNSSFRVRLQVRGVDDASCGNELRVYQTTVADADAGCDPASALATPVRFALTPVFDASGNPDPRFHTASFDLTRALGTYPGDASAALCVQIVSGNACSSLGAYDNFEVVDLQGDYLP
jgi:hypothetical protein